MDRTYAERVEPAVSNLPEPWREVVNKLRVRSGHSTNTGNGWDFVRKELLPGVLEAAGKVDRMNGTWEGRYKQNMVSYLTEVKEKLADFDGGELPRGELEKIAAYGIYITRHPLLDNGSAADLVSYRTFVEEGFGVDLVSGPKAA